MKIRILFLLAIFIFSCSAFAEEWVVVKSAHFIAYYKDAKEEFIKQLIDKSESYYDKITDDLGFRRFDFWLWDKRAKIYVYRNALDYRQATKQPYWSAGCVIASDKIIHTFPGAEGFFETVLAHEMGHIIFREFVGFDNRAVPLWLEEGVASYQQKLDYSGTSKEIIRRAMSKGSFMPLAKLSDFDPGSNQNDELTRLFYAEAFSLVDFLIKESGKDAFALFCQNLRDKKDMGKAVASSYSFGNMTALDEAWQKYLTK